VSDYHVTYTTRETRRHCTRAVAIARTDDFLELWRSRALTICSGSIWSISTFCFATGIWTFATTSFSSCLQACSRTWHPWGLSPVWLYVLRTCVCMSVFDLRVYDVQLKKKLHLRGRVNNYAFNNNAFNNAFIVRHEHQSVSARGVFQYVVCKVTYVLCDEICTNDTACFLYSEGGPCR
jgi:hypothetical protein